MIVKSLELMNFRNYERLSIEFDPSTNIIYGDNAQGKTNILEAICVSGTSRSLRGSRDREMIRFGQDEAHIRTIVEKDSNEYRIDIHLKKNHSKGIAVNKIPIKKSSELFGILNIIFFSPEDLSIIKSGPEKRRRFIDMELCQIDKIYLYNLTEYNKALNQRNRLLKDIVRNKKLLDTLPVWDDKLAEFGSKIIKRREQFVEEIAPVINVLHREISNEREDVKLFYEKNISADGMREALDFSFDNDMRLGSTTKGPHRDDLRFDLGDVDLRKYGSQGQQRTAALSLKLSEVSMMEKETGEKPVLLLDDVLSELDSRRQKDLLKSLSDTQTLITCTGLDDFVKNQYKVNKIFEIRNGVVVNG
ncbi:MAG: DNA replication/repair protein RecF [bacterium LCO1.1]|uniref:DNA replication and repair protein RecF n=1 Tax=Candidatus Weimeria bifida TaxID=2599074 RepID=A0A6N7J0E8_9FIRM|nr:DNA replication/repair protein RecF [Candidatus Weimeria bifida]